MTSKPVAFAAALSALLLSSCTSLPPPVIAGPPVPSAALFDARQMASVIQTIGSDAFEGRGPNTPGETKTVAYLIDQFRAGGVQPGGDPGTAGRSWTQAVPLLQSDLASPPQLSVKLGGKAVALTQGEEIAVRSPMNGQRRVNLANAPLLFVGYGVSAPERGWDDFKGVDVKGKILVLFVNDPDFEGGEGQFGGKAMTYYGRWTYKYEEAARRGAAGVMIVHETAPASYGWATVKNSNTNTMFDIVRNNPAREHTPFESWIQRDLAERLFADNGSSLAAMKAAAQRKDFHPVPLKATLNASLTATTATVTSHNVVGILPGRGHPDESVIYSAHWDHLGIGKPDANGDRIYNGALDNGSGIALLIAQARAFAREPRPDRSVVFMAVTAEEKGLLGSEYYGQHPLYPLGKTVALLNTDVMGVYGPARDYSVRGAADLELVDELKSVATAAGRSFTPERHPETGSFYRSDHFSLAKVGVPAITFTPGLDLVNGGLAKGEAMAADYTAKRYHQPDDEYSPDWDLSGMVQDGALLHALGMRLANTRIWPNWGVGSEFRAARDRSAAERN